MRFAQYLFWGFTGLFLGSLAIAAEDDAKKLETKKIDFHVRVAEPSGKPVAGAVIQVWKRHDVKRMMGIPDHGDPVSIGEEMSIRTDADGKANFSVSLTVMPSPFHMWRNSIHLVAAEPNHLVSRSGAIDSANFASLDATLILRRLMTIKDRVIDDQGQPVADATVFHTGNATPRVETITDAEGRFKLPGLPEGKLPVFVEHPKYHFHGQVVDTALAAQEFKLLAIDKTPRPMTTLPPVLSRPEELKLAQQIILSLWEKTLEAKEDKEEDRTWKLEQIANRYVKLKPWYVYEEMDKRFAKENRKQFFWRNLQYLYPTDPEEALAVLDSLSLFDTTKSYALVLAAKETVGIRPEQKLELLDRAIMVARTISEPNLRVEELTSIALALFDLGKVEEAKKIAEEIRPLAATLSIKKDDYAVAKAGVAFSLFDLPGGLRLTQSVQGEIRLKSLLEIAKRIAVENPAEAERIVFEAMDHHLAQAEREYHESQKGDWPEEEKFSLLAENEYDFAPVCYRLASADAARAKHIALKLQIPSYRAFCLGVIAEVVAKTDKSEAKKLIREAYETLTESTAHPRRVWCCNLSPPEIGGMLLPVVEEIDPTLVEECMWRSISFRHHLPTDDFILGGQPEWSDADLSLFLARYDRSLATEIFPPENFISEPSTHTAWSPRQLLVFTDPKHALSSNDKDSSSETYLYFKLGEADTLLTEPLRRWDSQTIPYK
jgi:hypothetical protein